ncbi:NADH:ubiquinone reductase (Na(+)-transporting) subunit F [Aquabacterium sp. OR-4]|uniref:NADH:ubiquinone reductase (Na(+)-transporting) subunit F n=1 Tax=Aquabacterium sp. OR-4 TaxID=2978127 RepID=UPI0028C6620B|nr:2Fe-2S iron-sulfur cluster binding domain-containing protein [Aquabacterium sp. OR-4]MDT7837049.1 2Fe-2S iron-sulfur cluster binding domain-containing protein [Aquabacterium sp. OR-4]
MSFQLRIEPLGQTLDLAEGQTLLDACLRAGVWLPHACCHGLCATCKVRVLEGEVEHGEASPFALMDFEREEGRALACCAHAQSDLVIEAEIDDEPDALALPVQDHVGRVVAIEQASLSVRILRLQLERPMRFQAGQYINLEIPALAQRRAFSIASPPSRADLLDLHVRQVPGGACTGWLHQQLAVGDRLPLAGPYGRFFVRRSAHGPDGRPLLFMAGGSGLSSPLAMILDLLEQGCRLPITLVYGQRQRSELYLHERLQALAAAHANLRYLPALSDEPAGSGWMGARGLVHEVAGAHFGHDFSGHKAYLCGPPAMIDACLSSLMQGRLFERDIHTERFLSAADAQRARSPVFRSV